MKTFRMINYVNMELVSDVSKTVLISIIKYCCGVV
jgi:hypothetical protein